MVFFLKLSFGQREFTFMNLNIDPSRREETQARTSLSFGARLCRTFSFFSKNVTESPSETAFIREKVTRNKSSFFSRIWNWSSWNRSSSNEKNKNSSFTGFLTWLTKPWFKRSKETVNADITNRTTPNNTPLEIRLDREEQIVHEVFVPPAVLEERGGEEVPFPLPIEDFPIEEVEVAVIEPEIRRETFAEELMRKASDFAETSLNSIQALEQRKESQLKEVRLRKQTFAQEIAEVAARLSKTSLNSIKKLENKPDIQYYSPGFSNEELLGFLLQQSEVEKQKVAQSERDSENLWKNETWENKVEEIEDILEETAFAYHNLRSIVSYQEDVSRKSLYNSWLPTEKIVIGPNNCLTGDNGIGGLTQKIASQVKDAIVPISVKDQQNNILVRKKVEDALLEVLDKIYVDKIFTQFLEGYDSKNFIFSSTLRKVIAEVERLRSLNARFNDTQIARYFSDLSSLEVNTVTSATLKKLFQEKAKLQPAYYKRSFTEGELKELGEFAFQKYKRDHLAAFQETYPYLSKSLFYEAESSVGFPSKYILQLKEFIETNEELSTWTPHFQIWLTQSCDLILESQQLFQETTFDPLIAGTLLKKIQEQLAKVRSQQDSLEALPLEEKNGIAYETKGLFLLQKQFLEEIEALSARLIIKSEVLTQYIESDPFTDQNILYPRRIIAEAFLNVGTEVLKLVEELEKFSKEKVDDSSLKVSQNLNRKITQWYNQEVRAYASARRTSSYRSEFLLNNKTKENPLVFYNETRALEALQECCRAVGVPKQVLNILTLDKIKDAKIEAMNEVLEWKVLIRDFTASLNQITRHYRQVSIPLSKSHTAVGAEIRAKGIEGIVPAARADGRAPINARTTILYRVNDNGKLETLYQREQHGIVDHYHLEGELRKRANEDSARQLVQHAIENNVSFVTSALELSKSRELEKISNKNLELDYEIIEEKHLDFIEVSKKEVQENKTPLVVYINTNLTTPTATPRDLPLLKDTHNEKLYSENQTEAFKSISGADKVFKVRNPVTNDIEKIEVDIVFIDFCFPVNYAIDKESIARKIDEKLGGVDWEKLDQRNTVELEKLLGTLNINGAIEGLMESTYKKLLEYASNTNNSVEKRQQATHFIRQIEKEAYYLREMFLKKAHREAAGDRFKMPRHIDLLTNYFRQAVEFLENKKLCVISAAGCMSAKDREGVASAETATAIVIQDMGGTVAPGHKMSDEERIIYNTFVTGAVTNPLLVTGYGGSKNAREISNRMGNLDAITYAAGTSQFAKS